MKRNIVFLSIFLLITACFFAGEAEADHRDLSKAFMKAYNTNIGMKGVIEHNKDLVPAEIKKLLAESHANGISAGTKAQKQYMAETMAREYKNVTGDISYLIEVKKDIFNSRLHAPVHTVNKDGINTVYMPRATAHEKNVFKPDNIIIHAGEWVRWVNNAGAAHIFASMPLIGKQILFTPSIKPDETWIQRFTDPGEYYYFCYIHNSMVGKITVLPAETKDRDKSKDNPNNGR